MKSGTHYFLKITLFFVLQQNHRCYFATYFRPAAPADPFYCFRKNGTVIVSKGKVKWVYISFGFLSV